MRFSLLVIFLCIFGNSLAEELDKSSLCLSGLKSDVRFSSIANLLPLDGQGATSPDMLTNNARPSQLQQTAIADWIDARSECIGPRPTQASVSLHLTFLGIVPDLYNGKTTFGEFNKKWLTLIKENAESPGKALDHSAHHHH